MIEDKRQVTSLSICNAHPTHRVIQALANLAIFGETPTNRFLLVRFIQQKGVLVETPKTTKEVIRKKMYLCRRKSLPQEYAAQNHHDYDDY